MLATTLGGLGLFLLGMSLLTDALKALAGDSLRGFLARFAGGRLSALASGAALTALVQSSSATSLATIGFVSAGLLSFEQGLSVVLGANLGTTSTGWLVSLLGLKFSVGKLALPLVGVGALLRLLGRGRVSQIGLALAGFALIFVGIDALQVGMQDLAVRFDPSSFPSGGVFARLLLVGIGLVMTVVMQSSSAAVATTLLALNAGSIDLTQAAALVVGQNVGTTVTAALGSIGASTAAKRTALAHVLFNLGTGAVTFVLLGPLGQALEAGRARFGLDSAPLLLAAFHTAFNFLGVVLFVPALGPFARLIERLIPERGPRLTRYLGPIVAQGPVALDAAALSGRESLSELVQALVSNLSPVHSEAEVQGRLAAVEAALVEIEAYLGRLSGGAGGEQQRHLALLHFVDHLRRLCEALREPNRLRRVREHPDAAQAHAILRGAAQGALRALSGGAPLPAVQLGEASLALAQLRREGRPRLLAAAAKGELEVGRGAEVLEAVRWLDRLGFHAWRAGHYLYQADPHSLGEASLPPQEPWIDLSVDDDDDELVGVAAGEGDEDDD